MQAQLQDVFSRHSGQPSDLIPVLQAVQEALGYIPREAMVETARFLRLPESTIYGVATFYTQFHLTRQGKHRVKVCQGTACHVRGGGRIMRAVKKKLGVAPGETTEDYEFTLERVACFGSCALAPVMVVDGNYYSNPSTRQIAKIMDTWN